MGVPSNRPTAPPSFNVQQFARDSDRRIAVDGPGLQEPEVLESHRRLSARPALEAPATDEAWSRQVRGALVVATPAEILCRLPLDHRAGFLLSQMDGATDLETLISIGPLPRADALRIVRELVEHGVVGFNP